MSAFEITIQNIQKVLDVINKSNFSSKVQIAKAVGASPALINNIFKRIEPEIRYAHSTYKAICTRAEETEFYKKFSGPIVAIISNFTIYFWQNKYICSKFGLSMKEVQTLRAYAYDELRSISDFKKEKRETAYYDLTDKDVLSKTEESELQNKFNDPAAVVRSNPTILLWQNKYISSVFGLSSEEIRALREKFKNVIQEDEALKGLLGKE